MCHSPRDEASLQRILSSAAFFALLFFIDADLAKQAQQAGCPCGGKLHSAVYPRKPRGVARALLGEGDIFRFSFCCADAACRRRLTPPSVRFLGRIVYLEAIALLAACLARPFTLKGARELQETVGVSKRTLKRWLRWWREGLAKTRFWRQASGAFSPALDLDALPGALMDRFAGASLEERLIAALRFLAPLTTAPRGLHAF